MGEGLEPRFALQFTSETGERRRYQVVERDIKRGRQLVDVLDTIGKAAFRGDSNVLAKWRNAKRVRALPGGTSGSDAGSVTTGVSEPSAAQAVTPASTVAA